MLQRLFKHVLKCQMETETCIQLQTTKFEPNRRKHNLIHNCLQKENNCTRSQGQQWQHFLYWVVDDLAQGQQGWHAVDQREL